MCLFDVLLEGHGVLGLQVVLDNVPLALHAPLAQRAVENPRLNFAAPVLALHTAGKFRKF